MGTAAGAGAETALGVLEGQDGSTLGDARARADEAQDGGGPSGVRRPSVAAEVPLGRNRRFQALWIGGAGAFLGIGFATLALPLLILAITGSAAQAGVYGFIDAAASVAVGIPAGMALDRYDRRTMLIASELVRASGYGTVALALAAGRLTMPHLFLVAAITGAARPFSGPGRALATRAVVAPSQLTRALAAEQVRTHTASIVGPPLAGLLYAVSRLLPLVGAVVGFVVSALCAFAIPHDAAGSRARREAASGGGLDGFRTLLRDPLLRICLIALALLNLGGVAVDLIVVVLIRSHGGSSSSVGLAMALGAVGGVAGAGLVTPLHRLLKPGWLLIALCGWIGALDTGLVLPLGAWWYGGLFGLSMLGVPAALVLIDVLIFRQVDDAIRGRTISATYTILTVGVAVGPLAGGLLLQYAGAVPAVLAFSAVSLLAAVGALGSRRVRDARWPEPAAQAAGDE